ncbi:pentatricopeptide repeat-containing protein At1g20230 [Cynara cardunculus var. scolymus]|uniref:Pentatricopeptide repeat-containing protein n=1 Tax=Cynara cardunculus var. scolymus TaxID=59895 RepID=A0A103YER7_CYNCS|nr:pentatricopeptide repeat-containing protein At1g20230 [Cynara cardunculus var. scolymus]XP_024993265.1 pentatricopeptide repeat-containing protein At1g20230 [Cynara cardunculus var. scolymus]KVI07747.1 Pentatricopeptide repeat-containing protein [Cynara cardunculus var. scolymus]
MARQALRVFDNHHILNSLDTTTTSLSQTRQAHAQILRSGLFIDTHFTTKLLSLYANHLRFSEANLLINSIENPDVFSFSTLIHAYPKLGRFGDAIVLFSRMISHGLLPDTRVVPSVIKACSGLSDLRAGKQVHGFCVASGLCQDSFVQSSLIHMYVKCSQLRYAHKMFDLMIQPDVVSCSALVSGYARQGYVSEAKMVFGRMGELGIEPNLVSWNGMVAGFNQSGHHLEAVMMFQKMYFFGFKPDGTTISSVLPAVGDLEDLLVGVQIHGCAIKQGLGSDKCIVSALIDMYGKFACTMEMSQVFDEMPHTDLGAYNALVSGFARNGLTDEALEAFKQLKDQGLELNVVSWTSIIACCSQHGKDVEALELFREMQDSGVKPNAVTIPCLLPACGNIAALMHGKAAHGFSIRKGIMDDVYVGSALIDMYANCGRIRSARLCFDRMPVRNIVCWNTIMGGYAMHGNVNEVIEIFQLMQKSEQKPDLITFTSLLSACSHSGLTEEGQRYFDSMTKEHGIKPRVEHYACLVTLLGRAGKLKEAYSTIKQMPFEPDACVWGALLSSCRVHHNLTLAEVAAHKLFELEPNNPGNYVLLSNIYASKGLWKEVDRVRDLMKSMGMRKNPGCSWIEIKNKVHMLLATDRSHPQMAQILEKMETLSMAMKKLGYLPVTSYVLQDVEDQEKEHILCGHSEKLAVVLGLLNTSPGSTLQVIKNLRICGDCHTVIKFISSFEHREIYVRDTNRFHHFKDGLCSCGDYW